MAESPENRALIQGWAKQWREAFLGALSPLAEASMGADGAAALATVNTALGARLAKLGLEA